MYLKSVLPPEVSAEALWTIYSACGPDGTCELEAFLADQPHNLSKYAIGMIALFSRVAEMGPQGLPDDLCRQVSKKIREFRKGRLRVFWFYDDGKLIICTHGHLKKTQKTPAAEIAKAEDLFDHYFEAKKNKRLTIIEEK